MTVERGYLLVEGHGEQSGAATNLVTRLWRDLRLRPTVVWASTIRATGLADDAGISRWCETVRARGDAALLLVLRDQDDGCVRDSGPRQADPDAAWPSLQA